MVIDIILCFDMFLNFFKRTRINYTLRTIGAEYISGAFPWDLITIVPGLLMINNKHWIKFYSIKVLRNLHFARIFQPVEYSLSIILSNYSRKRQIDLEFFIKLIISVF